MNRLSETSDYQKPFWRDAGRRRQPLTDPLWLSGVVALIITCVAALVGWVWVAFPFGVWALLGMPLLDSFRD